MRRLAELREQPYRIDRVVVTLAVGISSGNPLDNPFRTR